MKGNWNVIMGTPCPMIWPDETRRRLLWIFLSCFERTSDDYVMYLLGMNYGFILRQIGSKHFWSFYVASGDKFLKFFFQIFRISTLTPKHCKRCMSFFSENSDSFIWNKLNHESNNLKINKKFSLKSKIHFQIFTRNDLKFP